MDYTKPYLTVAQQIALLKSRGMIITDDAKAASYLERIGYYRLSGYWYPFRESAVVDGNNVIRDNFRSQTNFTTVVDLYVFDKKLRLLLLDAIERFEIALRVQIALLLGSRSHLAHRERVELHGVFARRADHTGSTPHEEWLRRTDEAFYRSKEEFAKHFKSKYGGNNPPIWIACELWDFGALSILFGGLNKSDQSAIAEKYGIRSADVMESWVRSINVVRNVCAHHGRLWNRPSVIQPKWPSAAEARDLSHLIGNTRAQTRLYGTVSILKFLLRTINQNSGWAGRLKSLVKSFPDTQSVTMASAGFPARWEDEPLWS